MSIEPEEFANRCNEYRRILLCYAYTCCQDYVLAEDIVQEALSIAHQKREHYFPEADLKVWLISLARNVWFRERKRLGKQRETLLVEENPSLFFDFDEKAVEMETQHSVLKKCLEKLDAEDRSIIECHFLQNLKYAEIASRMKRNVSWIKVRMFRARLALFNCVKFNLQINEA